MARKRITVATDFSSHAQRAIARALALAAEHDARLEVVHAMPGRDVLGRLFGSRKEIAQAEQAVAERLEGVVAALAGRGVEVGSRLVKGSAAQAITQAMGRHAPLVLVVGAHGKSSVRDVVFGTTAERLIESAPCPVLVVKSSRRARYRRVLVSVDLGPASARALAAAELLCPSAAVFVLHVFEALFEMKLLGAGVSDEAVRRHRSDSRKRAGEELHAFLREAEVAPGRVKAALRSGTPPEQIVGAAAQYQCDLTVVGRNRSLASDLFVGSVSKHILRRAETDVLVVARA
jgi:nucleotide-binding universal stress UspA family protein